MPPAAALGVGAGISALGSFASAKASQPKMLDSPPPTPLFPGLNQSYGAQLQGAGTTGINTLQAFAQDGRPSNFMDVFSTLMSAQGRNIAQGRAGLREQFGAQGLLGSSNFRDAVVDYESQTSKDFANILANLALQTSESSAQRQLQAAGSLSGMFGEAATAYTPSKVLSSGGQSGLGSALSSGGNTLTTLAMLKMAGILK